MLKYIYLSLALFVLGLGHLGAQNIRIQEEFGITRMLEQRKKLNFDKDRTIKVWSVQVMIAREKYRIMERKADIERRFADLGVEWSYEQPYYKLNAGAFFSKLEAASLLAHLINIYPEAYIFKNGQAKPEDMYGAKALSGASN